MTLSTSLEQLQDRRNKWLFKWTMGKKHFQRGEGKRYNPKNPTSQHKTTEHEQGQMNIGWTKKWPAGLPSRYSVLPSTNDRNRFGVV